MVINFGVRNVRFRQDGYVITLEVFIRIMIKFWWWLPRGPSIFFISTLKGHLYKGVCFGYFQSTFLLFILFLLKCYVLMYAWYYDLSVVYSSFPNWEGLNLYCFGRLSLIFYTNCSNSEILCPLFIFFFLCHKIFLILLNFFLVYYENFIFYIITIFLITH